LRLSKKKARVTPKEWHSGVAGWNGLSGGEYPWGHWTGKRTQAEARVQGKAGK
jgi:hypothetical protein